MIIYKRENKKSIDFSWVHRTQSGKDVTIYTLHKHTRDEGGSQDYVFVFFIKPAPL